MPKCDKDCNTPKVLEIHNHECPVLFHRVVVPAAIGDDETNPPRNGQYRNVLLVYEANGHVYLFSSDGIPTFISDGGQGVDDYNELENKPSINGHELVGDSSLEDIGVTDAIADALDDYTPTADLAAVALSGDYNDLSNTPTIPVVNDATLTITRNNVSAGTFTANSATDTSINIAVPTATSDLTNDSGFITNTVNDLVNYYTKTETDTAIGVETSNRENADQGLQEQIDALASASDVVDVVGTYAELQAYDTSHLNDNDIIKVLTDETHNNAISYYRWDTDTDTFSYIGSQGPFYTKAESDATFVPQTRTVNNKALSTNITLTASDVGALPDTTPIPTRTSDLINDGADNTSTYVEADELATVATSGSYNDLTDKPADFELVEMSYGESNAWAKFIAAYQAKKIVYCRASSNSNPATGTQGRKAFMAYVNNAENPTEVEFQYVRSVSTKTASQPVDQVFIYKLTNASGGTWTVQTRDMGPKLAQGTNTTVSYSNGTYTISATQPTVPTKTSDLTNDGSDGTSTYVEADDLATVATSGSYNDLSNKPTIPAAQVNSDWNASSGVAQILNKPTLATVATSGSYNDLSNKPTIPTVNNATLTIQKNGADVQTFTANQATNATANITVPTATSDLTNDSGYITNADLPTKTSDLTNDGSDGTAQYLETDETAYRTTSIPYGQCDSTSTSTVFTATVPGVTELRDGVCMWLKNGVVTSASGFTININDLGAKPVYSNMAAATRDTTIWNINYTMFFVYDSTRVSGGCWILYRGYNSDNNTIGYQLRTNSTALTTTDRTRYYRLLFTSADNTHWIPANTQYDNSATSNKTVNQRKINPFGRIVYLGNSTSYLADATITATAVWDQYAFNLGYSFAKGSALTMTYPKPVYIKCAPQTDGSAIIDSTTPYVQDLPSTEDGKIYIYLGIAYSATNVEMVINHPIYYYKDGAIREWTNATAGIASVAWGDITGTLSDQTDLNTALAAKANSADLATVATSGSYTDLTDKPTIPTVNNATLTIQKNSTNVATFTANAASNVTANISVPTATSDLTNDSGFLTNSTLPVATSNSLGVVQVGSGLTVSSGGVLSATGGGVADSVAWGHITGTLADQTDLQDELDAKANTADLATVATSGSYNDLTNKPTIGTGLLTLKNNNVVIGTFSANSTSGSTITVTTPTKTSDLTNDSGFITSYTETDPIYSASAAAGITSTDITNWNNKSDFSGSYTDLTNKPTIGNATLTIQKNGTSAGTFTANATSNKTINITVPTTAADVSALPASTKYGASIAVSINTTDYKVTTTLKDQDGNTLGTAQVIDLPLESVVVNGSYDSTNKKIVLTLQNGNTIDIPVADLVAGLQSEITSTNKLASDLVDDTGQTNKFMTSAEKTKLSGIAAGAEVNVQSDWNQTTTTADDYIKNKPSLATVATSGSYNDLSNKPTIPTVNNATLTIQKNGTNVQTFTANQSTNATANITVPTKTSDLTNDSGFLDSVAWGDVTGKPTFATVATSGSYNDLSNKPTIPTVNNATLTIQKNGTNVQTFTANSSTNKTANITVPTTVLELSDSANYATTAALASKQDTLIAGDHIDITSNTISAVDYVHSDDPVSTTAVTPVVTNDMIADGTITADKLASGATVKLTLSTSDIGEGAALAANTLYGVYI